MPTEHMTRDNAAPSNANAQRIIRKCVHCGFCAATCPTYVLLGDELDSPRGRIQLIKNMLAENQAPTPDVVKHIDRCLSCLACVTTCPSGVNYMHLIDEARAYIADRYRRPPAERVIRWVLAAVLPYPKRFRAALRLARALRRTAPAFGLTEATRPIAAMLALVPATSPKPSPVVESSVHDARGRVLLLQGCAEPVMRPQIRAATVRLLNRMGFAVVFAEAEKCCGALVHHLGGEARALAAARGNIDAWSSSGTIDAIIATAAGCGTSMKNYGHLLRGDPVYAERAAEMSALTRDISEFLLTAGLPTTAADVRGVRVAYQAACSLQHGQGVAATPAKLLEKAGFLVRLPAEAHLCCGSAGTYNILQPVIAGRLAERKIANLESLSPAVIATGNIGCAVHLSGRTAIPIVHHVELLDWATGGPRPLELASQARKDGHSYT